MICYGLILYSCSPFIVLLSDIVVEVAVQSLIGDDTSLGVFKSKVASKAHRLFGSLGELKIEGEINTDPLNMINFRFADEEGVLYKASCIYPQTYPKEDLVIKVKREN